jgi:hypothetical protein
MLILKLLHEQGLEGKPSLSKTRVDVWKGTTCLGTFAWVANVGWKLTVAQPPIRTHQDLELGLESLTESAVACQAADAAWAKFSSDRSEENWETYMGVLAAHALGQFRA